MTMRERIYINEVGLRDGLQNQPNHVSTAAKLEMAKALPVYSIHLFSGQAASCR